MERSQRRGQSDPYADLQKELSGPAQIGPPEVEPLEGGVGYRARFRDAMAQITVEGLRQGRDGLRGDLMVEVGPFGDGNWRTLTGGRLEFNSLSQRETWERRLRRRWASCDWEAVLDCLCAAILTAEKRLDKPAILLRSAARPAGDEAVLPPILHGRLPTLWYGSDGSLKSYVSLAGGLTLHTGDAWVAALRPTHVMRLLYADFEFDGWDHRERMRKLLGLDPSEDDDAMPDVAYLDCKGATLPGQVERIQRAAREFRSEFLIVDSISHAAEGPLNEDETARLYYRALGQIGLPSLSTAHVPKNGDIMRPFGSVMWRTLCRLAWHFQRCEVAEQGVVGLKLTNTKNSTEALHAPLGLAVRFEAGRVRIERGSTELTGGEADAVWKQVKALLARENRAMTHEEIALALGRPGEVDKIAPRIRERRDEFVFLPIEGSKKVRIGLAARRQE